MAEPKRRGNKWRIQIKINGERYSGTFPTKQAAAQWALQKQAEVSRGVVDLPVSALLERYENEVSKFKRGGRWEILRLRAFQSDPLATITTGALKPADIADWRDRRLSQVKSSTVNREWNLLSHVFSVARTDWGWLHKNPMSNVRRPKDPPPRTRRPTEYEIEAILIALGYSRDDKPDSISARVGAAYLFAIETGMRCGEICNLVPALVNNKRRIAHLPETKNGTSRDVPLSREAMRLIRQVSEITNPEPYDPIFGLKPAQVDVNFRKARDRAGIVDLTFHDSRKEAAARLAKKLDVMDLAKMFGWKDLKILQEVYYHPELTGDLLD